MYDKIAKNTLWLTGGTLVSRLLRVGLVIYAARLLGASKWGVFSYALSLAALFTVFSNMGLGAVLTREMVKHPEDRAKYISTSLFIKLFLLIVVGAFFILFIPYFSKMHIPQALIILTVFLVTFDSLRGFAFSITRALEKMHIEAILKIITQLTIVILGFFVLITQASIENLAAAYVVGSAIGLIITAWILRIWLKQIISGFDRHYIKKILSFGWPFALLGLLGGIMLNTDTIMLGWFRTASEIGYYSVAQKIILVLYILPTLLATSIFPSFTKLANKDKKAFGDLLSKSLKIVMLIAIPIVIGGIIIGSSLISLLFGVEYQASATAFKILLISLLITYPTTIIGNALFAYNKQKEFIKFAALGAISNIIFNFLLISPWGIEGVAVSTVLTQIISNTFIWIKMKKTNNFQIFNRLHKIMLASLLLGIQTWFMYWININIFIIIGTSIATYLLSLYLLKESALRNAFKLLS